MTEGYVYCFSNLSMPGIVKIGMTERTPTVRLSEANVSDTFKPPTPYIIEFAKKVCDPLGKERVLHLLLEKYAERIHPRREFFRVSPEEVRPFVDLMDGTMWVAPYEATIEQDAEMNMDADMDLDLDEKVPGRRSCRDMAKCFTHGQRIRHTIGNNNTWIGTYDSVQNGIVCDGNFYKSISGFAEKHCSRDRPDKCKATNGWKKCQCEVDGKWISTYSLPG
jgi:hypothetical protein